MCDFRKINKIKLIETNEIIDVSNNTKQVSYDDYRLNNFPDQGFYVVCASGSFHIFFDGNKILYECRDLLHTNYGFEVIDFEPFTLKGVET